MSSPALDVVNVSYAYATRVALTNVSLTVRRGEIFGLLGPNGSGKTTLFRILATLALPSTGNATILGNDILDRPEAVRRSIGVVFQSFGLDKKLTVLENLTHQGRLYGLSGSMLQEKARAVLVRLGVWDRKDELVERLSGGLQRRVEIAKGLLHQPQLLIMDEPSTGLDPGSRIELGRFLEDLRRNDGTTILLTTHLLDEADRCDRIALFDHGRLVTVGTPSDLKATIGGDIIYVSSDEPLQLAARIKRKLRVKTMVVNGIVHIEKEHGHRFIPKLIEAFPKMIQSVTVGKPTLEDVFVKYTGHGFAEMSNERPSS